MCQALCELLEDEIKERELLAEKNGENEEKYEESRMHFLKWLGMALLQSRKRQNA